MHGEIALDTSVAIQLLNSKESVDKKVRQQSNVLLLLPVALLIYGMKS